MPSSQDWGMQMSVPVCGSLFGTKAQAGTWAQWFPIMSYPVDSSLTIVEMASLTALRSPAGTVAPTRVGTGTIPNCLP